VRHGRGAGGEVATRRRDVGEGPDPVGRLWAADSSARGWRTVSGLDTVPVGVGSKTV
jgi:hypothetical protein